MNIPLSLYCFVGREEPEVLFESATPEQIQDFYSRFHSAPYRGIEIEGGSMFFFDLDALDSEVVARVTTAAGCDAAMAVRDSMQTSPELNRGVN